MMRTTSIFLIFLGLMSTFLIGIKVGTNISKNINLLPSTVPIPSPTATPSPTAKPTPDISSSPTKNNGNSIYTDSSCGFSFSYPGSYLNSKSSNGEATIITDPHDTNATIAATCLTKVPRPPVSSENIESITLSGQPATLYHDKEREIVIVKNPNTQMEILLAGTNPLFTTILKSFKLL